MHSVLNVLHSLVDKSNINRQLEVYTSGGEEIILFNGAYKQSTCRGMHTESVSTGQNGCLVMGEVNVYVAASMQIIPNS